MKRPSCPRRGSISKYQIDGTYVTNSSTRICFRNSLLANYHIIFIYIKKSLDSSSSKSTIMSGRSTGLSLLLSALIVFELESNLRDLTRRHAIGRAKPMMICQSHRKRCSTDGTVWSVQQIVLY